MIKPINQKSCYRAAIAFMTLVAFFVTTIGSDAAWAFSPAAQAIAPSINISEFKIPLNLGEIREVYRGAKPKTIIHIQDAHCNYSAQSAVKNIIAEISDRYNVRDIALEGGEGSYDLSPFTKMANTAARQRAAEYFASEGRINGAELFAIAHPDKVRLTGLEDADLYMKNLAVYRESLQYKPDADAIIKRLQNDIALLKKSAYSQRLKDLDAKRALYDEQKTGLREHLAYLSDLAKTAGISLASYANLDQLMAAIAQEGKIDFTRCARERELLVYQIQKTASVLEVETLVKEAVRFKEGKIRPDEFYLYLLEKGESVYIDVGSAYPNLVNYSRYLKIYESLDKYEVFEELDRLEAAIVEKISEDPTQRELYRISKDAAVLKDLFSISLSRNLYSYYLKNKERFGAAALASFIDSCAEKFSVEPASLKDLERLDSYRQKMEKFYEYALKRDDAFLKNISGILEKTDSVILFSGGFHTENLKELFKKEGFSYVVILPKFESSGQNRYHELLSGASSRLEEFIKANTSSIAVASILNKLNEIAYGKDERERFETALDIYDKLAERGWATYPVTTPRGYFRFELCSEQYAADMGTEKNIVLKLEEGMTVVCLNARSPGSMPSESVVPAPAAKINDAIDRLGIQRNRPNYFTPIASDAEALLECLKMDRAALKPYAGDINAFINDLGRAGTAAYRWLVSHFMSPIHSTSFMRFPEQYDYAIRELESFLAAGKGSTEGPLKVVVWSLGCSTGDELASFAAIINEVVSQDPEWKGRLGKDIVFEFKGLDIDADIVGEAAANTRDGFLAVGKNEHIDSVTMNRMLDQPVGPDKRLRDIIKFEEANITDPAVIKRVLNSANSADFSLILLNQVVYQLTQGARERLMDELKDIGPSAHILCSSSLSLIKDRRLMSQEGYLNDLRQHFTVETLDDEDECFVLRSNKAYEPQAGPTDMARAVPGPDSIRKALAEMRFDEAEAIFNGALEIFKQKESAIGLGTNHRRLVSLLEPFLERIEKADRGESSKIVALFVELAKSHLRVKAISRVAYVMSERAVTGSRGGLAEIDAIWEINELMGGTALSGKDRRLIEKAEKAISSGHAYVTYDIAKVFDTLRSQILLGDGITELPKTNRNIFREVSDVEARSVAEELRKDMKGAELLRDANGKLILYKYDYETAVTEPYFAVAIDASGMPMRMVIKDAKRRNPDVDHVRHAVGNGLMTALNFPAIWVVEGKRYAYIREIRGEDIYDFIEDIGTYGKPVVKNFFFALGMAASEAYMLCMEDRAHNMIVRSERLGTYSKEELLEVGKRAIMNIDRENALAPKYLGKLPSEDTSETVTTFLTLANKVQPRDVPVFARHLGDFMEGFKVGSRRAREFFGANKIEVEKKIWHFAGDNAPAIFERVDISDENLERLTANIKKDIETALPHYMPHDTRPQAFEALVQKDAESLAGSPIGNGLIFSAAEEPKVIKDALANNNIALTYDIERLVSVIQRYFKIIHANAPPAITCNISTYQIEFRTGVKHYACLEGNKIIIDVALLKLENTSPKELLPFLVFVLAHEGSHGLAVIGADEAKARGMDVERFRTFKKAHRDSVLKILLELNAAHEYVKLLVRESRVRDMQNGDPVFIPDMAEKIKDMARLAAGAKAVTIATSPGYIHQGRALVYTKEILRQMEAMKMDSLQLSTNDLGAQVANVKYLNRLLHIFNILRKGAGIPELPKNATYLEFIEFFIKYLEYQNLAISETDPNDGIRIVRIKDEALNHPDANVRRLVRLIHHKVVNPFRGDAQLGGAKAVNYKGANWTIVGFESDLQDPQVLKHERAEIGLRNLGLPWYFAHIVAEDGNKNEWLDPEMAVLQQAAYEPLFIILAARYKSLDSSPHLHLLASRLARRWDERSLHNLIYLDVEVLKVQYAASWLSKFEKQHAATRQDVLGAAEGAAQSTGPNKAEIEALTKKLMDTAKPAVRPDHKIIHTILVVGDEAYKNEDISKASTQSLKSELKRAFGPDRGNDVHICRSYKEASELLAKIEGCNWTNTFLYVDPRVADDGSAKDLKKFIRTELLTKPDGSILMAAPVYGYSAYSQLYASLIETVSSLCSKKKPIGEIKNDERVNQLIDRMIIVVKEMTGSETDKEIMTMMVTGLVIVADTVNNYIADKAVAIDGFLKLCPEQHRWNLPYAKAADWEAVRKFFELQRAALVAA